MSNDPKKQDLSEDELDGVSGGVQPGPPDRQRGLGDPGIHPSLVELPEPTKIALPSGPTKVGH